MPINQELYKLAKLFYGPRDGFSGVSYIRENSPLFPETFPPMQGRKIGKGSYYKTKNVECFEDRVIVEINVHIQPSLIDSTKNDESENRPEEFLIHQLDIFTWDNDGNVSIFVDYPDGKGESLAQSKGQVIHYSEDQLVLDFESAMIDCPHLPSEVWANDVTSCMLKILHTDTLIHTDVNLKGTVYSYDLLYIAFLDKNGDVLGTQKIDAAALSVPQNPFLSSTSNALVWDIGV